MMIRKFIKVVVTFTFFGLLTLGASAAPVADVSDWAQRFQDAALHSDFDAMQHMLDNACDPRLKLGDLFGTITKSIDGKRPVSAEQFHNEELGSFFRRLNFAVLYEHNIIFYSVEFVKEVDGWQILGFAADGNVNNILARHWPG